VETDVEAVLLALAMVCILAAVVWVMSDRADPPDDDDDPTQYGDGGL
jgi:hypothetical protein